MSFNQDYPYGSMDPSQNFQNYNYGYSGYENFYQNMGATDFWKFSDDSTTSSSTSFGSSGTSPIHSTIQLSAPAPEFQFPIVPHQTMGATDFWAFSDASTTSSSSFESSGASGSSEFFGSSTISWTSSGSSGSSPMHSTIQSSAPAPEFQFPIVPHQNIQIVLRNSDQWKQYFALQTEMLVLNGGRRLFPFLDCAISGLHPQKRYFLGVQLILQDFRKYQFVKEKNIWIPAASQPSTCPESTNEVFMEVVTGAELMKRTNLQELKIFNVGNEKKKLMKTAGKASKVARYGDKSKMIQVSTQFMYRPIIRIYEMEQSSHRLVAEASFPETTFIAVSGYNNDTVKLKKSENKFVRADIRPHQRIL